MRGYTVHLLFHLLAIAAGAACGIAGALWWRGDDPNGLWLAIGALVVGTIVLILEILYIHADQPPAPSVPAPQPQSRPRVPMPPESGTRVQIPPRSRRREPTRPDLKPVAPAQGTLLQPSMDTGKTIDQKTKLSAIDALNEQWRTDPRSRQG
ncbi:hypothetical protein [Saccharopolyspora phatthalungensis]|uniref:Uncharacterized protein n=1 Tax=Saccharopolyspora phatthalungensis TaxID=664693 RepID=A0A840Q805_9PSEU|nr:hypothetical protein [Saccharopolyspora phatthalungensis]MBB5155871.1 hypothetical protein [Saccharopolyspora phatthalungensis]